MAQLCQIMPNFAPEVYTINYFLIVYRPSHFGGGVDWNNKKPAAVRRYPNDYKTNVFCGASRQQTEYGLKSEAVFRMVEKTLRKSLKFVASMQKNS